MTGKDDLTLDMEKGSHEGTDESHDSKATPSPKRRVWLASGALAFLGIVVFIVGFIVGFSITYVNENKNDSGDGDGTVEPPEKVKYEYVSSTNPFKVKLSMFDQDIARGYTNSSELEEDLGNVARFLLNNVLNRNLGKSGYGHVGIGQRNPNMPFPTFGEEDMDFAAGAPEMVADESKNAVGDEFDDYGTNNQEEGVEEGDVIVSDGENVYAAHGDSVVVWDPRTGDLLGRFQMPPIKDPSLEARSSMFAPGGWYNNPSIRHLLLQGDRLIVVVEGYGPSFRANTTRQYPIFYDYLSTHVRLYKIVSREEGILELVSKADLNGRFSDARAVDGKAHIITTTGIDTHTDLISPFESYNFEGLTKEAYVEEVKRVAEDRAIPHFVGSIMRELTAGGGLPKLFRISLLQSKPSGTEQEELAFPDGVVNSLAQVHSFDMSSDATELSFVKSGAFLPNHWVQVYGAENSLILSGEGWEYDTEKGTSTQSTNLLSVSIDGASSAPGAIGSVAGSLLNSHSVDVKDNILRVATTIRETIFFRPFLEEPMPVDEPVDEILPEEEPGEDFVLDAVDPDEEETKRNDATEDSPPETGDFTASEPIEVDGEDDTPPVAPPEEESSTQNLVITLDLTAPEGIMTELGRLELGKPNEVFTAVRFFDNVAYAVTFLRRDPLYVLDLSSPDNPKAVSELDITGFSSYMHSLNDDNTLILTIGEEADDEGIPLGIQISIFDMRNFDDPKLAQRYVIEKDQKTYSWSDSLWDFMTIRVAAGRLIIPADISNYENKELNFHGFIVFIANENVIEEDCRISHAPSLQEEGMHHCYYCGSYLPRRSMIFDGKLMTTENQFVRSTDLDTCELDWKIDIEDQSENAACCGGGYDDFILE